jgi:predicted Zn-dependent peptidase
MLDHKIQTLKSGLKVITVPMDSVQSLTVMALSNTGSRYEKPEKYGIAHFFEHIVFKGTDKYPIAQDLAEVVDSVGANFNAFTGKEYTGYYVQVASKHFELALDVVSDMLLTPKLRQEDIDREKGVIIEEMNMYADMPKAHISNLFEQMVFKGNGLSHDIIGSKETVSSITSADFEEFLKTWYGMDNLTLVVAGERATLEKPATLELIEKMFSKVEDRKSEPTHPVIEQVLSSEKFLLENKETEQIHFTFGWPGLKRKSEDRYTMLLLNAIVGGNMSSRLFSEIREKRGLCYYVYSEVRQFHEGGLFGASAGVDPNRVEEAIEASLAEFNKIAVGKKPITSSELKRAKDYVAGKMILGLEDSESVAQFFGLRQLLHAEIETPSEAMEKMKKVTLDQVQALAKKLIKKGELRFALIGNPKNKAKIKEIINKY